jgi:hypothetical protein
MNHVPIAPFSNEIPPFYFAVGRYQNIPNQNWNDNLPEYGEPEDYSPNKVEFNEDRTEYGWGDRGFVLKQQPRRFSGMLKQGVFITRCAKAIREHDFDPADYREEDWGLQIAVTECDIKHRPWEGVDIVIEMEHRERMGSPGDFYTETTYYNITVSLNSSHFNTSPAVTSYGPEPGIFGGYYYRTGYDNETKTFYSVTETLGTDITRSSSMDAPPPSSTSIHKIISISPSSALEPPTP